MPFCNRFRLQLLQFSQNYVGSLILLYVAFVAASFVTILILLAISAVEPQLNPDSLGLKVKAFSSEDGPLALLAMWCLTIVLFVWSDCTRGIIRYYGKRAEEFIVVLFASLVGSLLATGLVGYGWSGLPLAAWYSLNALVLSLILRRSAIDEGRRFQALAAVMAAVCLGLIISGPTNWPDWFLSYVTLNL